MPVLNERLQPVTQWNPLTGKSEPVEEGGVLPEGSACTTEDGKAGHVKDGKCIADEPMVPEELIKPVLETKVTTPEFKGWQQAEPITYGKRPEKIPDWWNQTVARLESIIPQKQPITGNAPFAPGLPPDWFAHNVPYSAWLPNGNLIKAQNPNEFNDLVRYLQDNQDAVNRMRDYQGQPTYGGYTVRNTLNVPDFVSQVETFKDWNSAERQQLEYWQMQQRHQGEFKNNLAQLSALTGIPDTKILDPDTNKLSIPSNLQGVAAYADRLRRQQGRPGFTSQYTPEEIQANIEESQQVYIESLKPKLPQGWDVMPLQRMGGEIVPELQTPEANVAITTKGGWKLYSNNTYEAPTGEVYTEQELLSDKDALKQYQAELPTNQLKVASEWAKEDIKTNDGKLFLKLMQQTGSRPEAMTLLKTMYPDITEEEIRQVFPPGEYMRVQTIEEQNQEPPRPWYMRPESEGGGGILGFRGELAPEGTPLNWLQRSPIGMFFSQPQSDEEAALGLAFMGAIGAPAAEVTPLATVVPKWIRTLMALGGLDVSGGGAEYVGEFIGKITNAIKQGTIKTVDFAKGMADVALRQGNEPLVVAKALEEVPNISRQEAENIVADAYKNVIDPERIVKPVTTVAKPGEPFEEGMVKQVDGSFAKVENATFEKIKPGDPIPEVGSPDRFDTPNGQTYVRKPTEVVPKPTEPSPSEAQKPLTEGMAAGTPKPAETVSGVIPPEKIPTAAEQARVKFQESRAKVVENWNKQKNLGAVSDPLEQARIQAEFWDSLIQLAKDASSYGIKTADEFARELGVKLNTVIQEAWDSAIANRKPSYEALVEDIKKSVPDTADAIALWEARKLKPEEATAFEEFGTAIKNSIKAQKQEAIIRTTEKGQRVAVGETVAEGLTGTEAHKARIGALKGKYTEVGAELPTVSPENKEIMMNYVNDKFRQVPYWDKIIFDNSIETVLSGEALQPHQQVILRKYLGDDLLKIMSDGRSVYSGKKYQLFLDAIGIPKAMMAAFDASAVLAQGGILSARHPIYAAKMVGKMFKSMGSEAYTKARMELIEKDLQYGLITEGMKTYISPMEYEAVRPGLREESFMTKYTNKIPGIKQTTRGYLIFLNEMRFYASKKYLNVLEKSGHDLSKIPEILQHGGNLINILSGRGSLGKLNSIVPELNAAMFAPRWTASRFQILFDPRNFVDPVVRTQWAKYMGAFAAWNMTVLGLAALAGGRVELDPRSSDFLKVRFGATSIDVAAGLSQIIRFMAQATTGTRKSMITGNFTDASRWDMTTLFSRGKESPILGLAHDLMSGTKFTGEKLDFSGEGKKWQPLGIVTPIPDDIAYEVGGRTLALMSQDMIQAFAEEGLIGLAKSWPSFFGARVTTYEKAGTIQSAFYNEKNTLAALEVKIRELYGKGDIEGTNKFANEHPEAIFKQDSDGTIYSLARRAMSSLVSKEIRENNTAIKEIKLYKDYTDEQRQKLINQYENYNTQLMRDLLDALQKGRGKPSMFKDIPETEP